jgi:hypothetical protein
MILEKSTHVGFNRRGANPRHPNVLRVLVSIVHEAKAEQ